MSLLEWWGESRNPQPTGRISLSAPLPVAGSSFALFARGFLGASMLVAAAFLIAPTDHVVYWTLFAVAYFAISFFVRFEPDYSNVGLLGGIIDHPFRWSDDVNRHIAGLRVFFMPGRFAIASIRDAVMRMGGKRVIVLERRDDEDDGRHLR